MVWLFGRGGGWEGDYDGGVERRMRGGREGWREERTNL